MLRVIEYPTVVRDHLDNFRDVFTRPQARHFAEYLTGLIVCDQANIKQINNCFIAHREYSNKDRFMTHAPWPEDEVNRRRINFIKEQCGLINPINGYLAIDDTICEKTGKHIAEVGKYYDHAQGHYVLGHNIVTSQYITSRGSFPIGWRLYLKRDKHDKDFKTKIELAEELIQDALDRGLQFKTVVFDAWYLAKELVKVIELKGLYWVGAVPSNRIIYPHGQRMNLESFHNTLTKSDFKEIDINGKTYYCFTISVKMSRLGKVRILIAHEKLDLSDTAKYLATNNLRWEARRIVDAYQHRWPIDSFYRVAKQNLGFEDYEMRDLVGIKRHWYLVFLSYTLLTLSSMSGSLRKWMDANVKTIGAKCRWAADEIVRDFTLWVLKQNQLCRSAEDILTVVFASKAKLGERFQIA
jgi:SRSO17 transposase